MEKITRREFFKTSAYGAVAAGVAACAPSKGEETAQTAASGEMEYRINHNSGDRVSLLGYGCMRWPMIKDADGKDIVDQKAVDALIDRAMEAGVNFYDTSPVYLQGQSELATAKSLSRYPRGSYYLSTKLSNFSDWSREASEKMYRRSLEIFNTDYVDYYLLHNLSGVEAFKRRFEDTGILDFLLKERENGHIRNLGFSFHGNHQAWDELIAYTIEKYHWDFVLIQMNYIDWYNAGARNTDASHLYTTLEGLRIPVMIMEPLLGGRLGNVPEAIAREFKTRERNRSVASWAFRFVGSYPGVLTVLSGMTYMEHLEDNLKSFTGFVPLTEQEKEFLTGETATRITGYPTVPCTACQYCMPCPYGIDIPGIFKFYNDAVNEGTYAVSSQQENFRKLRKDYLTTYNKAIPTVRQADHCITCGRCVPACPQHIPIPGQLHRIDKYIEALKRGDL